MNILVAEDVESNRNSLVDILRLEGHTVETATTALDFVRRFHGPPPDLILMDIMLPGTDGMVLLMEMKQRGVPGRHPGWADVRVVLITALKVSAPDGVPVVQKPYNTDDLLKLIREIA